MKRTLFEPEHDLFRAAFRAFVERDIAPFHEEWARAGAVPRDLWRAAGRQGFLCMDVPEEYGGAGARDYRFNVVIGEELWRVGATGPGFVLHTDIVVPYILHYGTPEQRQRWLPGCVSGECIAAIAMTEPGAGSDLAAIRTTALRDGDSYVVNGQKTFISNGILNDLVIVAAKTDPDRGAKGISLLVIERGMPGYERGRRLEKIGLHAQDTAELFFHDVRVPRDNLLGEEGQGFRYLMEQLPRERLAIAVGAVAAAEAALEQTIRYCREREAFGRPLGALQTVRFTLAELATEVQIGRVFVDQCVLALNQDELTAETAAMAKWWTTELQQRVVNACLQLHGGYGYMREYPIARAFLDARVQTIYGGATEIMKEIIGRSLKLE